MKINKYLECNKVLKNLSKVLLKFCKLFITLLIFFIEKVDYLFIFKKLKNFIFY